MNNLKVISEHGIRSFYQGAVDKAHCGLSRRNPHNGRWITPDKNWIKINVDASRRDELRSTTIGYIIRDSDVSFLKTYSGKIGDYPVLVVECEAIRQAILEAIRMKRHKVYINSDSQIVVNAVNKKMIVPKDIINLVEDMRWLYSYFTEFMLDYCIRNDNKEADDTAKRTHL